MKGSTRRRSTALFLAKKISFLFLLLEMYPASQLSLFNSEHFVCSKQTGNILYIVVFYIIHIRILYYRTISLQFGSKVLSVHLEDHIQVIFLAFMERNFECNIACWSFPFYSFSSVLLFLAKNSFNFMAGHGAVSFYYSPCSCKHQIARVGGKFLEAFRNSPTTQQTTRRKLKIKNAY